MYIKPTVSLAITCRFAFKNIVVVFLPLSLAVCIADMYLNIKFLAIPFLPISTLGTAVSLLLAFRNNSAYSRWWEARGLWGGIVNSSRNFARQILTLTATSRDVGVEELKAFRREVIYRHFAYLNALRMRLRQQDAQAQACWFEIGHFLNPKEKENIDRVANKPVYLLQQQAARLQDAFEAGMLDSYKHVQIDNTLNDFFNLQGGCERIKNTPLPRQYAYYTKIFTWFFVLLLPFGFVGVLGWVAVPLSVLISWIFITIEQVGHYTENPFDNTLNDVPMSAICRNIEIDLRQMLGETELPSPIQAVDGVLM
jgi:putative membrane protein